MKKKILSVIVILMLCLGLMPVYAFAEGNTGLVAVPDKSSVNVGDTVTVTIKTKNAGTANIAGLDCALEISDGLEYVSSSCSDGFDIMANYNATANFFSGASDEGFNKAGAEQSEWELFSVTFLATKAGTQTVKILQNDEFIFFDADYRSLSADVTNATITVLGGSAETVDLVVAPDKSNLSIGDQVTVTIKTKNAGTANIAGLDCALEISDGLEYVSSTCSAAFDVMANYNASANFFSGASDQGFNKAGTEQSEWELFTVTFWATKAGTQSVKILRDSDFLFFDAENNEIPAALTGAMITVSDSGPEHRHTLNKTEAKDATCTESGNIAYWTCESCKKLFSDEDGKTEITLADTVVAATGHQAGETVKENEIAATCEKAGSYDEVVYCTVCKDELSRVNHAIDALGHDFIEDPETAADATCEEAGKKADKKCSRCDAVIEGEAIPALDHDWGEWEVVKEATEDEEGLEKRVCSRNETHEETRAIPKKEHVHNLNMVAAKDATCAEEGNIEHWICSGCEKLFKDGQGTEEINIEDTVIGKKEHLAGEPVRENEVAATCKTDGSYEEVVYCTVCKTEISRTQKTVDAPGHTPEAIPGKEATCTETGLTEGSKCSVCGEILQEQEIIGAAGHKWETIQPVSATCTEDGYTGGVKCEICGEHMLQPETVPATGHSWDNGEVTTAATCTEAGVKTYTCKKCGETKTESIPAKEHNYKTDATRATLTKDGSITEICTECGDVKSKTVIYRPKSFKLSADTYVYNGRQNKPAVTVTDVNGKKIAASNYKVSYKNNKNVGKATVTVTFKDGSNYEGTKSLSFTINPKGTTLSKVTGASKGFTAKWKKQATQTTGYQIQYSTNKNFKSGNKTVTVNGNKKTSKKISKLKSGKTYYVRVRTYKTVSGKKYYSSWSKAKAVKTK